MAAIAPPGVTEAGVLERGGTHPRNAWAGRSVGWSVCWLVGARALRPVRGGLATFQCYERAHKLYIFMYDIRTHVCAADKRPCVCTGYVYKIHYLSTSWSHLFFFVLCTFDALPTTRCSDGGAYVRVCVCGAGLCAREHVASRLMHFPSRHGPADRHRCRCRVCRVCACAVLTAKCACARTEVQFSQRHARAWGMCIAPRCEATVDKTHTHMRIKRARMWN